MPTAIVITFTFMATNIVIAPYAYLYKLFKLAGEALTQTSIMKFFKKVLAIMQFMTLGILVLILFIIVDPIIFFLNLFNEPRKDIVKEERKIMDHLTYNSISIFEEAINDAIVEIKVKIKLNE